MKEYTLGEKLICLNNVTAGYGDKIVLKDLNLIEHDILMEGAITGQSIGIVGCSGRGKSTLFRLLAGLMKPIEGQVLINNISDGIAGTAKEVEEGDISLVDQKYTLFRHMTVFEILMYSLRKDVRSVADKKILIDEMLDEWDLTPHKDKYSGDLSGGQRQRTSILSKILTNNTFLILDEPTSGLDPIAVKKIKGYIRKFKSTREMNTVIFSTHDLYFAAEMADVIYVIGKPESNSEYSTIIKSFDMRENGLTWKEFSGEHVKIVNEILDVLEKS